MESVTGGRWLTQARLAAGFANRRELAERIGATQHDLQSWEEYGKNPTWKRIEPLAAALGVTINDVLGALWGEVIDGLCRCGCGGRLAAPNKTSAWHLVVTLSCADCGAPRIYDRPGADKHSRRCGDCGRRAGSRTRRVERMRVSCVGYEDHGVTVHAKRCPGSLDLLPSEISRRQEMYSVARGSTRLAQQRQRAFIDRATHTFRCGRCSTGSMMILRFEDRIRKTVTSERIRSGTQRRALIKDYAEDIGLVSPNPRGRPKGSHLVTEHSSLAASRGQIVAAVRPGGRARRRLVGICELCGKLTISNANRPVRTHGPCFRQWVATPAGKRWTRGWRRRGSPGALAPRARGRPENTDSLTRHFAWAILHHLGGQSVRAIAAEAGVSPTAVHKAVAKVVERLPSLDIVPAVNRLSVELLTAATSPS